MLQGVLQFSKNNHLKCNVRIILNREFILYLTNGFKKRKQRLFAWRRLQNGKLEKNIFEYFRKEKRTLFYTQTRKKLSNAYGEEVLKSRQCQNWFLEHFSVEKDENFFERGIVKLLKRWQKVE